MSRFDLRPQVEPRMSPDRGCRFAPACLYISENMHADGQTVRERGRCIHLANWCFSFGQDGVVRPVRGRAVSWPTIKN